MAESQGGAAVTANGNDNGQDEGTTDMHAAIETLLSSLALNKMPESGAMGGHIVKILMLVRFDAQCGDRYASSLFGFPQLLDELGATPNNVEGDASSSAEHAHARYFVVYARELEGLFCDLLDNTRSGLLKNDFDTPNTTMVQGAHVHMMEAAAWAHHIRVAKPRHTLMLLGTAGTTLYSDPLMDDARARALDLKLHTATSFARGLNGLVVGVIGKLRGLAGKSKKKQNRPPNRAKLLGSLTRSVPQAVSLLCCAELRGMSGTLATALPSLGLFSLLHTATCCVTTCRWTD